jgi:mRNA interferase MazF
MISEGQVVLFRFFQTDQQQGKLRPALVLRELPGQYDDWLSSVRQNLSRWISGA